MPDAEMHYSKFNCHFRSRVMTITYLELDVNIHLSSAIFFLHHIQLSYCSVYVKLC